jgi:hypothetical protein
MNQFNINFSRVVPLIDRLNLFLIKKTDTLKVGLTKLLSNNELQGYNTIYIIIHLI